VVTSRLDDIATYESSGALPQNVNYAVKGGLVYDFCKGVTSAHGSTGAHSISWGNLSSSFAKATAGQA
jgi:hypothetical protein